MKQYLVVLSGDHSEITKMVSSKGHYSGLESFNLWCDREWNRIVHNDTSEVVSDSNKLTSYVSLLQVRQRAQGWSGRQRIVREGGKAWAWRCWVSFHFSKDSEGSMTRRPNLPTYTALMKAYAKAGDLKTVTTSKTEIWKVATILPKRALPFGKMASFVKLRKAWCRVSEAKKLQGAEAVMNRLKAQGWWTEGEYQLTRK